MAQVRLLPSHPQGTTVSSSVARRSTPTRNAAQSRGATLPERIAHCLGGACVDTAIFCSSFDNQNTARVCDGLDTP